VPAWRAKDILQAFLYQHDQRLAQTPEQVGRGRIGKKPSRLASAVCGQSSNSAEAGVFGRQRLLERH